MLFRSFFFLPKVDSQRDMTLWKELQHFFSVPSMLLLVIIALGCGGLFSWLSYIEPLMLDYAHLPREQMPTVMIVVGIGMVVGNSLCFHLSWCRVCSLIYGMAADAICRKFPSAAIRGLPQRKGGIELWNCSASNAIFRLCLTVG